MAFVPRALAAGSPRRSRRWFVVHTRGLVVRREGDRVELPTDEDVARLGLEPSAAQILGDFDDDIEALAVPLTAELTTPLEALNLRALASTFDAEMFGVAGRAMHVVDWLTTHRFCGRCGAQNEVSPKERSMICPRCGLSAYPRISPAIITLVRRGDEALLARNARFPAAFFSTLAGFSEIGETLEETLAREVHEEVGIHVDKIRYFGSQPWPFPHSLMIAFTAEWAGGEIVIDGTEIADARWFSAHELPPIPPSLSIARRLIDAWVDEIRGR